MDKETLSNYGWIVICVLVLAVMIALAGPFGTFVAGAVKSTTAGLFGVNQNALGAAGIDIEDQAFANCEHTYKNYKCTQCGHIQDHTCNYENYKCTICGDIADHTCTYDSNNLCTICGEEKVIEYAFNASDYDAKMGTTTATDAHVVIPETFEYNGTKYKVTSVGGWAFSGCTSLESITIPDSVTSIKPAAFSGCSSLKNITIPDGITEVGSMAFKNCTSLTSIIFPEGVKYLGNETLYVCTALTTVNLPKSITRFDYRAVTGDRNLTTINYAGTTAEWNNITKDSQWNYSTNTITVNCSDGILTVKY